MKLWQCDWVPSSVADWLCRELDERGIPGTTYTHTLLSLLHPYFCPHPVPREPSHLPKGFLNFECIGSLLNSGPLHELEVLYEELEDNNVHPDADFPELNIAEPVKEGTRRSKRRQKRKLQQLSLSPEKLWKVAALQCLLNASDENQNLEGIIEELFLRLTKNTIDANPEVNLTHVDQLSKVTTKTQNSNTQTNSYKSDGTESCYSSNFPPLSVGKSDKEEAVEGITSTLNWKSLIKNKLSPEKRTRLSPIQECTQSPDHSNISQTREAALDMEIRPENLENGALENKAYCFIPISREEPPLYPSLQQQQQQRETENGGENGGSAFRGVAPVSMRDVIEAKEREKLEEWECAGGLGLMAGAANRAVSVDLLGNRLYERSIGSADTTRCNSNSDLMNAQNEEVGRQFDVTPLNPGSIPNWAYSLDSWKGGSTENVWNNSGFIPQPYGEAVEPGPAVLAIPRQDDGEKFISKEEDDSAAKNPLVETWPPNQNWSSLVDAKSNAMLSSAFRCSPRTAFKEGARHDCHISIPEMTNDNLKNIWSDCNDNNINAAENNRMNTASENDLLNFDQMENKTEDLCESFRQLRLEHLWEDPLGLAAAAEESIMTKSLSSESSSISFFEDHPKVSRENLTSEDVFRMKAAQNQEIEENFLLHKIPSGPSGPYVELRHTENSGFSAVIPQDRNFEAYSLDEVAVAGGLSTPQQGGPLDPPAPAPAAPDEENLLTSPRTHFRPIRRDSHGSLDEARAEDGPSLLNALSLHDPDLVFQRSGSGTLYLESDLLKGSPKKYMAYREPPAKPPPPALGFPREDRIFPALPTASPSPAAAAAAAFVPKFKIVNNEKFCQTEGPDGAIPLRKGPRKYDFLYGPSPGDWEGGGGGRQYPNNMKLIWEEQPRRDPKEAWELGLSGPAPLPYPKWSTQDMSPPTSNWPPSIASLQISPPKDPLIKTSLFNPPDAPLPKGDQDAFSKIKFIWHNKAKGNPMPGDASGGGAPLPGAPDFAPSWEGPERGEGRRPRTDLGSGIVVPKSPWNVGAGLTKEEPIFQSVNQEDSLDLASRWQLQLEVNQEADEILGGLLPPSPLQASPPYESPSRLDGDELKFLDFLKGGSDPRQPIEDLDHLEPGWDLNEGFEWGPSAEEIFPGEDDEEGGQEVLVYENEDGETVMLPVEYLEDSLYDQIFGTADTPIGGSLPDLPGGQISELKKASLSYKLSRRSRGGERFVPPSRRPCSFFLEGNCRRSDCKFSHDLLTITCRFWEEGSCLKGETCPFRHALPPPSRRRNRSEGDQASLAEPVSFASLREGTAGPLAKGRPIPKRGKGSAASMSSFEIDSETDFPVLGSSVESKIGSLDDQNFPSHIKATKISKKKKKYITVTKSLFQQVEGDAEKGVSVKCGGGRRPKGLRSSEGASVLDGEDATPKKKKDKDCESLRKVLRKRYPLPPQPPFSHEDGTLSDF